MALALTLTEGSVVRIADNIIIQVKRKKRTNGTLYNNKFIIVIEAPKDINIARLDCKNKEDNNV